MPKNQICTAETVPPEKKYTREALLKDKRFSGYQKDFLAVVLSEPEYTIAEAEKTVKAFFERK